MEKNIRATLIELLIGSSAGRMRAEGGARKEVGREGSGLAGWLSEVSRALRDELESEKVH